MTALDFFIDFAITGQVEGVGLNSKPDDWSENLGADYVDDRRKNQMRRDYGLVELGFARVERTWRCATISIQAHRLWWHADNVPPKLRRRFGAFPRSIPFEETRKRLRELDHEPHPIDDQQKSDHERYYVPGTKILIYVLSAKPADDLDGMPPQTLWSMNLSVDSEVWAMPLRESS